MKARCNGERARSVLSNWSHCSDFKSHLATWQSVSTESAISTSTKGGAHAHRGDQSYYTHSNSGRSFGHEHEGKDSAVHGGVARDGALRGDRSRSAWGGDPRRRAQRCTRRC